MFIAIVEYLGVSNLTVKTKKSSVPTKGSAKTVFVAESEEEAIQQAVAFAKRSYDPLSYVYNIFSGVITSRIEPVLPVVDYEKIPLKS